MSESKSGSDQNSGQQGDGRRRRRRGRRRGKSSGNASENEQQPSQQKARSSGGGEGGGNKARSSGGGEGGGNKARSSGGGEGGGNKARSNSGGSGANKAKSDDGKGSRSGRRGSSNQRGRSDTAKKPRGQESADSARLTVTLPSAPKVDKTKRPPKNRRMEHTPQQYGVVFFDTFAQAKSEAEQIKAQAATVDQLNVVIRAEGDMDDPDLQIVDNMKVFAGAAWALIHERRMEDGWYDEPR